MERNKRGMEFLDIMHKLKKVTRPQGNMPVSPGEFMLMEAVLTGIDAKESDAEKEEGIGITEIAEKTGMSKPAMSRMISTLEKKEYLKRYIHKEDRRVVCVQLTLKGRSILDEMKQRFETFVCSVFEEMGDEDAQTMVRLFNKLYTIIQKRTGDHNEQDQHGEELNS